MFESINKPTAPNWKLRIVVGLTAFALGTAFVLIWRMTQMPIRSYRAPLPPLSASQAELAQALKGHVTHLSADIGERNIQTPGSLQATEDYIQRNLGAAGYTVTAETYAVEGHAVKNLEARLAGTVPAEGSVIVAAHYDSVEGTVGADDNATGVAAVLELARMLRAAKSRRTIRFVFFVNEEPPYFQTDRMGSLVYARQLRRDHIPVSAMISLEMLGFYSDSPGSQKYPSGLG